MPILSRWRAVLRAGCIAAALMLAGCRSPQSDAYLIEQIRQMGDELNDSRQQAADLLLAKLKKQPIGEPRVNVGYKLVCGQST